MAVSASLIRTDCVNGVDGEVHGGGITGDGDKITQFIPVSPL